MSIDNTAQRVDVERFEVFANAFGANLEPYGDGYNPNGLLYKYQQANDLWAAWQKATAPLLLQVAEQAAEIERLRASAHSQMLERVKEQTMRNAAERAREESFIRVAKLAERWDRIADTHGERTFTGNDHRLFANELRAAFLAANGGGRED